MELYDIADPKFDAKCILRSFLLSNDKYIKNGEFNLYEFGVWLGSKSETFSILPLGWHATWCKADEYLKVFENIGFIFKRCTVENDLFIMIQGYRVDPTFMHFVRSEAGLCCPCLD